jgi:hypothetical protein
MLINPYQNITNILFYNSRIITPILFCIDYDSKRSEYP